MGEKIPWYNRRCLRCFVDGLAFLSMWRMPAPRQPRFPFGATWMDISSAGRALPRAKVQILLRPLELSSSDVFSYYENADGRVSAFSSCIIRIKVVRQPSKLDERGQYPHGALTQCSKKVVIVQVGENFMVFVSGGCIEQPNPTSVGSSLAPSTGVVCYGDCHGWDGIRE